MTPEQKADRLRLIKETVERYQGIYVRRCEECDERFMTPYSYSKYCHECANTVLALQRASWFLRQEFDDYDEDVERIRGAAKDRLDVQKLISALGMGGTDTNDGRYVIHVSEPIQHKTKCASVRGKGPCNCDRKKMKGRGKVFKETDK